jgi:hypothetical protein
MNHVREWTDTRMNELRNVLDAVRKTVSGEIKAA